MTPMNLILANMNELHKAKFHYARLFGAGSELVWSWLRIGSEHASDQIPLH